VFPWGRFKFFQKLSKVFSNECLSPVSTTPAINILPVIAGDIDTGDKFIASGNKVGD
jgi:hypothetical protein